MVDISGGLYSWDEYTYDDSWYADDVDVAIEQLMENPNNPDPNDTWLYYNVITVYDVSDHWWEPDDLDSYSYWNDNQHVAGIEPAHGDNFPWSNTVWLKMQTE